MGFKIPSLHLTDGYKPGHKKMLAPGTVRLAGSWIPRSIKYAPKGVKKIVSFGQQMAWMWLHDEFEENFFMRKDIENLANDFKEIHPVTNNNLYLEHKELEEKAKNIIKKKALQFVKDMSLYLGMEYDGEHFGQLWDLGYLPIKVKALPEGIETDPNIPHMTFINTVDGFAWLTLYLETVVSSLAWKPSTIATIAKLYRRQAEEWVAKTNPNDMWLVDFMCHDFSARGLDPMSQWLCGLGWATSFKGSDTLPVIPASRYFYGVGEKEMPIFSVNASEHSVSTTKIFTVGEQQMIADWLQVFPKGILSIVADTFDLWTLITKYLPANKEAICRRGEYILLETGQEFIPALDENNVSHYYSTINNEYVRYSKEYVDDLVNQGKIRYTPGKLVIRPDSGDPVDIICGLAPEMVYDNPDANYRDYCESKGVIELLWDIFGGTEVQGSDGKMYKVLDSHIGAIYGDSITPERQLQIYQRLAAKGFAATNIVLGVGSYTMQFNTRDTLGFAAKGTWFEVLENSGTSIGEVGTMDVVKRVGYGIYKDPITDDGTKKSLRGLLQVYVAGQDENGVITLGVKEDCTPEEESQGLLQIIYEDGKFYNQVKLDQVREKLLNSK